MAALTRAAARLPRSRQGRAGGTTLTSLALEQLRAKDALVERLSEQVTVLLARSDRSDAELTELREKAERAKQLTKELDESVSSLLREKGIHSVRGALELLLETHTASSKEPELANYFARTDGLGAAALECANKERKVLSDNGGRPHSPQSLAKLLFLVKKRLSKDSHDKRSPEEYQRDGESIILRPDGLSESDVAVLSCFFRTHHYPVRVL